MDEEGLSSRESEVEHISGYSGRTITESVRGKAKYSLLPDMNNGFRQL
jgi:hypothetical protein